MSETRPASAGGDALWEALRGLVVLLYGWTALPWAGKEGADDA